MINTSLKRQLDETENEFCQRLYNLKETLNLTWQEITDTINTELGLSWSTDKYRKEAYKYYNENAYKYYNDIDSISSFDSTLDTNELDTIDLNEDILALRAERAKLADERTQINALYRRLGREESLKEIAAEVASQMNSKFLLPANKVIKKTSKQEGILLISDWHYGIEIDSLFNKYNPDIAKERIAKLRDEVINLGKKEEITHLHVVNLGDLITGRIHLQLRINSRFDVITQIIEVTELLAEMLSELSKYFNIDYYDTLDNHSRLEPNYKESIDLESLTRITTWVLKDRLKGNIVVHDNIVADDIITFESLGHKVIGVHGHHDKLTKVIDNLSLMTKEHYDLVVTAHLHHFSAEEKNETVLVSNSSLMGTDDYAMKLRLNSKPSQCLIVSSKENICKNIYKIELD